MCDYCTPILWLQYYFSFKGEAEKLTKWVRESLWMPPPPQLYQKADPDPNALSVVQHQMMITKQVHPHEFIANALRTE